MLWSTKQIEIKHLARGHKHAGRSRAWTHNIDVLVIMSPMLFRYTTRNLNAFMFPVLYLFRLWDLKYTYFPEYYGDLYLSSLKSQQHITGVIKQSMQDYDKTSPTKRVSQAMQICLFHS